MTWLCDLTAYFLGAKHPLQWGIVNTQFSSSSFPRHRGECLAALARAPGSVLCQCQGDSGQELQRRCFELLAVGTVLLSVTLPGSRSGAASRLQFPASLTELSRPVAIGFPLWWST